MPFWTKSPKPTSSAAPSHTETHRTASPSNSTTPAPHTPTYIAPTPLTPTSKTPRPTSPPPFLLFEDDGSNRIPISHCLNEGELQWDATTTTPTLSPSRKCIETEGRVEVNVGKEDEEDPWALQDPKDNWSFEQSNGSREVVENSNETVVDLGVTLAPSAEGVAGEPVLRKTRRRELKREEERERRGVSMSPQRKTKKSETLKKPHSSQPKKLGVIAGVYIPTFQNIVGIIIFVRLPWIVGTAGLSHALLIAFLSTILTLLTALSMSAIVTNGKVPGGGAYYIISRSLGKEFGGSVGILFYLGNVVGGVMYALGVVEIVTQQMAPGISFGNSYTDARVYGTTLILILATVVAVGKKMVTKTSILFFCAVCVALLATLAGLLSTNRPGMIEGVVGFPGRFSENWSPGYTKPSYDSPSTAAALETGINFFELFGIFFPAVTGVLAGASRSAELEDPQRNIPKGTLAAQMTTTFMYFSFIILLGITVDGALLRTKFPSTGILVASVSWPSPWVTLIGCVFASLGAALQCFVNAPKLLQAMAKDDIAPILSIFKPLSQKPLLFGLLPAQEPRRALFLTLMLAEVAMLVGNLDVVSKVVTMFYLNCYTFVNASTAVQGFLKTPNWRPAWKYYHWLLSALGALMALTYSFMISWIVALASLLAMGLLFKYVEYRGAQVQWGDGLEALYLQIAQKNLWTLERQTAGAGGEQHEHVKNWKPHVMLFVELEEIEEQGEKKKRVKYPTVLDFLAQLKKGGGLNVLATVCAGDITKQMFDGGFKEANEVLKSSAKEHNLNSFTQVSISSTITSGILSAIQCTGVGYLRPNTIMLGWPTRPTPNFIHLLRSIIALDKALILLKGLSNFPTTPFPQSSIKPTVDVYWVVHDGGILTLLAHILLKHPLWRRCHLRIFALAQPSDNSIRMRANLRATLEHLRIEATADVLELGVGDVGPFVYERTVRMKEREELLRKIPQGGVNALVLPSAGSLVNLSGLSGGGDGKSQVGGAGSGSGSLERPEFSVVVDEAGEVGGGPPVDGGKVTLAERMKSFTLTLQSRKPSFNFSGTSTNNVFEQHVQPSVHQIQSPTHCGQFAHSSGTEESNTIPQNQSVSRNGQPQLRASSSLSQYNVVASLTDIWDKAPRSRQASNNKRNDDEQIEPLVNKTGVLENEEAGEDITESPTQPQEAAASFSNLSKTSSSRRKNHDTVTEEPMDPLLEDPRLHRMNTAVKMNSLMRSTSTNCQLIICNLPAPGIGQKSSTSQSAPTSKTTAGHMPQTKESNPGYSETEYIEYLEAMTEGIPRIMLVKGTGFEVVSDFY
ncbi:hypothetical protein HDV05_002807 [Chytridiales sp. JEL 0842]|nr:hypothetical protein HDV05_002807 [Chytridiales sp. JEL 0842]